MDDNRQVPRFGHSFSIDLIADINIVIKGGPSDFA